MLEWWPYRMEYLMESMRAEGRGEAASWEKCPTCAKEEPVIYSCVECFGSLLECQMCFLERHKRLPLHTKWNGEYFECTTLQALGLRIQLGHLKGECVNPERGSRSFTVLHTNRVHLVNIDFCRCDQHVSDRQQLLQSRWYPATVYYPKTCATIELLNQFHILMLAGKISHHEFYLSLERLTDNLEINTPNTRYKAFMRIVRQFRAERMLKRGGGGCTEDGIERTEAGQLAIVCPVCPQPGVNLPEGWEAA
ncbi:hypothetical protein BDN71DRAFT_1478942, partial [Pleurotus eryngii]